MALAPAPLSRRVLAGGLDALALAALAGLVVVVPAWLTGVLMPMWSVLAVLVGYAVLPLVTFGRTPGLRALGLELVSADGGPVDATKVLMRETVGRGLLPAAVLLAVPVTLATRALGLGQGLVFEGVQLLFFQVALVLFGLAVVGHLMALGRPDRRTLADLMAGSAVRVFEPAPTVADPEVALFTAQRTQARRRAFWTAEAMLVALVVGLPVALEAGAGSSEARLARLRRETLEEQLKYEPTNGAIADEVAEALDAEGDHRHAEEIREKFRQAHLAAEREREQTLRASWAKDETSTATTAALVELLDDQHRIDEALVVYRRYVEVKHEPERRVGLAKWLWERRRRPEAIAEARAALQDDPTLTDTHALLGKMLLEHGDPDCRAELYLASLESPTDGEVQDDFDRANEEHGPLTTAELKALKAQHARRAPTK
ncbi:MAG: RDD family protein [Myxococcaceae bacterium]|nr:RDD family protein [Myxococcaceae bacterium]